MTTLTAKYKHQTLERLEKEVWPAPTFNSHLVTTCHNLRQKPLGNFTIEDLRIMLGQDIGSSYLLPFAIEKLRENILAEGDFYPGDLLNNVLTLGASFWKTHPEFRKEIESLLLANKEQLDEAGIEYEFFLVSSGW